MTKRSGCGLDWRPVASSVQHRFREQPIAVGPIANHLVDIVGRGQRFRSPITNEQCLKNCGRKTKGTPSFSCQTVNAQRRTPLSERDRLQDSATTLIAATVSISIVSTYEARCSNSSGVMACTPGVLFTNHQRSVSRVPVLMASIS